MPNPLRKPSHSNAILIAAMLLTLSIVLIFFVTERLRYDEVLAAAKQQLQAKTDLIAEHMARTLEMSHSNLHAVAAIRKADLAQGFDSQRRYAQMKAVHENSIVFKSLFWTDADGVRVGTSFTDTPETVSLAHREHFLVPRADRGYAARPFIGTPVYAEALDAWILAITLRLENRDGTFAGIAGGAVDPAYLSALFGRAALGEGGSVRLLRNDGVLLTQYPYSVEELGKNLDLPDSLAGGRAASGQAATPDGRIVVQSPVTGSDASIVASISTKEALSAFWSVQQKEIAIVGLLLGAVLFGAYILARDMRRREALEIDIRRRGERARDYARASSDWFFRLDAELRFRWVSSTATLTLDIRPEWFIGRGVKAILPAQYAEGGAFDDYWRALESHEPFLDFEYHGCGKTGDRVILVSGTPFHDDTGAFAGYRGSVKDITALRRSEQRILDVVDSFPGRVVVFDRDERLILFNQGPATPVPAVNALLQKGDTYEQCLRKLTAAGIFDVDADDAEAWIIERMARFRRRAGRTLQHMGGKIIEVIERPMADGGTISLRFDVTERERATEIIANARKAAEKANHAKSDFLASMSHEFRTPLNAILGFSLILQIDKADNLSEEQQEYIRYIENSGQHLLNLVNEVLDLAGIEAGKLKLSIQPIEVAEFLKQITGTMAPVAAKAGIKLEFKAASDAIPAAQADNLRLRQVVLNLISNAIKYNRPNGSVQIAVEARGDAVHITVADDGMGIAAEHQDQVFTPFSRFSKEKSTIEGAGIGLSLSKRLVEAMHGSIGFETEFDVGSTFWIDLPAAKQERRPRIVGQAAPSVAVPAAAGGGYSVLYIEDNPASLRLMERLLQTIPNVRMYTATSGSTGLELVRAHTPDVIILDVNLPGMSGFNILSALQDAPETCSIPVIALTAAARARDVERGLDAGFFRYITKPLDIDQFMEAMEAALARRTSAAPKPRALSA